MCIILPLLLFSTTSYTVPPSKSVNKSKPLKPTAPKVHLIDKIVFLFKRKIGNHELFVGTIKVIRKYAKSNKIYRI